MEKKKVSEIKWEMGMHLIGGTQHVRKGGI